VLVDQEEAIPKLRAIAAPRQLPEGGYINLVRGAERVMTPAARKQDKNAGE
jgi:hypothetical protein